MGANHFARSWVVLWLQHLLKLPVVFVKVVDTANFLCRFTRNGEDLSTHLFTGLDCIHVPKGLAEQVGAFGVYRHNVGAATFLLQLF